MFNDAPTSRSPLRSRIAASIERQIARTGRSKSSGTIIRSAPISFADTAFTIPSLSLRDKIANEDAPGIHAPRHALSRATPKYARERPEETRERGGERSEAKRSYERKVTVNSEESHGDGVCGVAFSLSLCHVDSARFLYAARKGPQKRSSGVCERAPLARTP